ncbi:hypothetical protein EBT25_15515 [bacterium]|nr:hypothetical protein [bacterium]
MNNKANQIQTSKSDYVVDEAGKIDTGAYKGAQVLFKIPDMDILVEGIVLEARVRYGHLDLLVSPKSGTGTKWFQSKNIIIKEMARQANGAEKPDAAVVEETVAMAHEDWKKSFKSKLGF